MLRVPASGHSMALPLSGPRFVDTSALIRLPDDCTVGYIIECKLGGRLQPSPLFHSHLETLQLLGAAQLPEQVRASGRGRGGGARVWGSPLWTGKLRPRLAEDPFRASSGSPPSDRKGGDGKILGTGPRAPAGRTRTDEAKLVCRFR